MLSIRMFRHPSTRKFIVSNPAKCTGCLNCEYACSEIHERLYNPKKSRIRVARLGTFIMALTCRLCQDPPCVSSCPSKALYQNEQTRVIIVDEERCNGCGWCIQVCQFGGIDVHASRKSVMICDLCQGDPECVKRCPTEALEFMTTEELAQKARNVTLISLAKEILIHDTGENF